MKYKKVKYFFGTKKAFSLTELLVIVAILGVFIVWLLTSLNPKRQVCKAHDATRKSDLKKIQIVLEDYYNDHEHYPLSLDCNGEFLPYLQKIPCDPDGSAYFYDVSGSSSPQFYRLYANLCNLDDPEIIHVGCEHGCGTAGEYVYNFGVTSPDVYLEAASEPTQPTGEPSGGTGPTSPVSPTGVPPSVSPTSTPAPTIPSGCYYACAQFACQYLCDPGLSCPHYLREDCYNSCANPQNQCY